jgi:6,7-dimethyl-8-ribityllumazine synthase
MGSTGAAAARAASTAHASALIMQGRNMRELSAKRSLHSRHISAFDRTAAPGLSFLAPDALRATLPARMSDLLPSRPRHVGQRRTVAIISGQYNGEFVKGLTDHAIRELNAISASIQTLHFEVPGAFEIPLAAQRIASRKDVDAVIALGVIIEGETEHAALIGRTVTDSLQQIALANDVPVIHEVLLVKNAEQARKRCIEDEINRGTEAARVAIRMIQVLQEIGSTKR